MLAIDIEQSPVLQNEENWYETPTTKQKMLNSQGQRARLAEVQSFFKGEKVLFWGKRSRESLEESIYITETSGRIKVCPKCSTSLLQWNPMDKELCCTECGETITESESKRMQSAIARGVVANVGDANGTNGTSSGKRKYEKKGLAINTLDATFADPKTRNEKLSESAKETKGEFASAQLITLLAKMELRLGSPETDEFLAFATKYSQKYYYQKERKDEILESLKKVNDKITALNSGLDLFDDDEEKELYEGIILKAIKQKEVLEKELESFQ